MKSFITLKLFIFLLPLICAAAPNRISGEVRDGGSDSPLGGVNIEVLDTKYGTVTDESGYFTIENIPPGDYSVKASYIGYKTVQKQVSVKNSKTTVLLIYLEPETISGESIIITAKASPNRAIERESPVAFSKIERVELARNYTTGDVVQLIKNVPGVWTSSAGLGESDIYIRGFSSQGIRFFINDIPMNNPEDHQVVWSNWAGLSHMARSIEIHRGPGFSLLSPNAFGGSVNISTIGIDRNRRTVFHTSAGIYNRMGIASGENAGKIVDPSGGSTFKKSGSATNYIYSGRFNSGPVFDRNLNLCLFFERKAGDSYLLGTNYDGYTFGLEADYRSENHYLYFLFFVSPQSHGQAFALQDIDLLDELGREYNRKDHIWQENYYSKPFFSLNHDWQIAENKNLTTNFFYTQGRGADQSIVNDAFDVESGEIGFQPSSKDKDAFAFGSHAQYLYSSYGFLTSAFEPIGDTPAFVFKGLSYETDPAGTNFFVNQHTHSYQRQDRRNHRQLGMNSVFSHIRNRSVRYDYGLEARYWRGHRRSNMSLLKISDFSSPRHPQGETGEDIFRKDVQAIYDYETEVINLSAFAGITYQYQERLTIQAAMPVFYTYAQVIENPIELIDFGSWTYFDEGKKTTGDILSYGRKYSKTNDYLRQFRYFTPWIGSNYNINRVMNVFTRVALSQKEPAILDWYDYHDGPLLQKDKYPENENAVDMRPEKVYGVELGTAYRGLNYKLQANYYYTVYEDKIERVIDINGRQTTLNAGKALFQGIEFAGEWQSDHWDLNTSASWSRNRWQEMNVAAIFDNDAADVEGKVVPFAPERMFSASLGYRFNFNPANRFRIALRLNYWDEYYGTYTNRYLKTTEKIVDGLHYKVRTEHEARLPYFLDISAQVSYLLRTPAFDFNFRIDANNLLNRSDNFMRARYSIDYTRDDFQAGRYNWYVLQAPLFNVFFTMEISIRD